jgi:hypothetical protein
MYIFSVSRMAMELGELGSTQNLCLKSHLDKKRGYDLNILVNASY